MGKSFPSKKEHKKDNPRIKKNPVVMMSRYSSLLIVQSNAVPLLLYTPTLNSKVAKGKKKMVYR